MLTAGGPAGFGGGDSSWLSYNQCVQRNLQVEHGELPLPGLATPTTGTCRLHWIALQPGLQLCVLAGHSYVHGQFVSDIQQVLNSHKGGMAVEALRLPTPVTAITIIDSHWVTCNSATPNDGCRWETLIMRKAQQ